MEQQTPMATRLANSAAFWFAVIVLSFSPASQARAPEAEPTATEQTDLEPTRLLLLELWPRVLVAANVDTAETGTGLDVQFATDGPPLALSRENTRRGFVLLVNRDFIAENDRLLDGMLIANRLNLHESFRSFALDRAAALAAADSDAPVRVRTFNESIGWSAEGFERVRTQAGFHEAARAARLQGLLWLLARVVIRSALPLREGAKRSTDSPDKRAAQLTFEISGSPFPPLSTGLLTAALEHPRGAAREEPIACAMAAWLATGDAILRALPDFNRRMERDPKLQRSMEGIAKDIEQLRDRGRCATPL